ncbi:MAG: hypothetical protein HY747_08315 [Elusimicrobia bacterium]|nr:hypothetical protein [Elusimicrobiota bacterium]
MAKRYFIDLTNHIRIRVAIELKKNKIVDLVVQLEIFLEEWVPVVRYNYAHGIPHRDLMYAHGKKAKEYLKETNLAKILNFAIGDLKKNWVSYLKRCGYEEKF